MKKNQLDFLVKWESEKIKASGRSIYAMPKYLGLYTAAAILIILIAVSPWLYGLKLDRDLAELEANVANFTQVEQKVKELELLKKQVTEGNEVIERYHQSKYNPQQVFQKIMPLLPTGTTITSLTIQEDKRFQVTLNIPTPSDVSRLWVSFEESGLFESVDIDTVSLQDMPQSITLDLKFVED